MFVPTKHAEIRLRQRGVPPMRSRRSVSPNLMLSWITNMLASRGMLHISIDHELEDILSRRAQRQAN